MQEDINIITGERESQKILLLCQYENMVLCPYFCDISIRVLWSVNCRSSHLLCDSCCPSYSLLCDKEHSWSGDDLVSISVGIHVHRALEVSNCVDKAWALNVCHHCENLLWLFSVSMNGKCLILTGGFITTEAMNLGEDEPHLNAICHWVGHWKGIHLIACQWLESQFSGNILCSL